MGNRECPFLITSNDTDQVKMEESNYHNLSFNGDLSPSVRLIDELHNVIEKFDYNVEVQSPSPTKFEEMKQASQKEFRYKCRRMCSNSNTSLPEDIENDLVERIGENTVDLNLLHSLVSQNLKSCPGQTIDAAVEDRVLKKEVF